MLPVEKDHITEVYLCLLLHHASSVSPPHIAFPLDQCTSLALRYAPSRGNICTHRKPNEKPLFIFCRLG